MTSSDRYNVSSSLSVIDNDSNLPCPVDITVANFTSFNLEDIDWFFYNSVYNFVIGYLMPWVLIFGLLGNALFIFVTVRVKSMRTITNVYLVNLAIADSCYIALGTGEKLASIQMSPVFADVHPFGFIWCVTVFPLARMCAFASLFLVTLVTVDKYYAICKPLEHRMRTSPGRSHTKYIIFLAWTVAFSIAASTVPNSYKFDTYCVLYPSPHQKDFPNIVSYCNPSASWIKHTIHGIQVIPFFIALVPNIFLYHQIMRRLNKRKLIGNNVPPQVRNRIRARNTVSRMLVFNGSIFFLCNIPFFTLSLLHMVMEFVNPTLVDVLQEHLLALQPFVQLLLYINSALNPIVYGTVNRNYRKSLYQAVFGKSNEKIPKRSISLATGTTSLPLVNMTTLQAPLDETYL